MTERRQILDERDQSIIQAFSQKRILKKNEILKFVKDKYKEKNRKSSESTIDKRISKLVKELCLLNKDRGIYSLNPEYEFIDANDKLIISSIQIPNKPSQVSENPIEISPKAREEHTKDLLLVIRHWIENFPNPLYFGKGDKLFDKVESHDLFDDMHNHLVIWDKWTIYKADFGALDKKKEKLLKIIEYYLKKAFRCKNLNFINYKCPQYLRDYDCCLADYLYNMILNYELSKVAGNYTVEDEYTCNEYADKVYYDSLHLKDNINFRDIGGSIIWSEDNTMFGLIRLPNEYRDNLLKGKDDIFAFMENYEPYTGRIESDIASSMIKLEKDKEKIMKELNDLLHVKIFPGECKYLGRNQN